MRSKLLRTRPDLQSFKFFVRFENLGCGSLQLLGLRKTVQRLANMLEVDGSVQARANALVEEVELRRNGTQRAPKAELTTAGCLFIASREGEVPLTIINVALAAGVSNASLTKWSCDMRGGHVLLPRHVTTRAG